MLPDRASWAEMHFRLICLLDLVMHQVNCTKLMVGFQLVCKLSQSMQLPMSQPGFAGFPYPQNGYANLRLLLVNLLGEVREIGLDVAEVNLEKAINVLDSGKGSGIHLPPAETQNLHRLLEFAQTAMCDQLSKRHVLVVPADRLRFYNPEQPVLPTDVSDKFPAALAEDMRQACNCYALEQSTACVFHLMRVMEIALRQMGEALGATVKDKDGWLVILKDRFEPAINAMPEGSSVERDRKKQFQQVRAHLHAVRLAWRNDTMHPKETYTPEQAKELVGHVLTFLTHLAALL